MCPARGGASSQAEGAVAVMRMESLSRSRMGSGQASVAGSMLRAAAMGPGQCLSAESFLATVGGALQDTARHWHCSLSGVS